MPSLIEESVTPSISDDSSKKYTVIGTGQLAVKRCWTENEKVRRSFSTEFVRQHAEILMGEIMKISANANPRMANRQRLSRYVSQAARLQVLVIEPPPAVDDTELRGQVGITGELKAQLSELYLSDDGFKDFFGEVGITPKASTDMWCVVWAMYKQVFSYMQVFQLLRLSLDDTGSEPGADWYRPYWAAMCGFWESRYRLSLGMESPLAHQCVFVSMIPVLLSAFDNCVLGGIQQPDHAWEELIEGFEAGNIAWRANSWLRPPAVPLQIAEMRRKHYRPDALIGRPLARQ